VPQFVDFRNTVSILLSPTFTLFTLVRLGHTCEAKSLGLEDELHLLTNVSEPEECDVRSVGLYCLLGTPQAP